jgi:hypothetical protein
MRALQRWRKVAVRHLAPRRTHSGKGTYMDNSFINAPLRGVFYAEVGGGPPPATLPPFATSDAADDGAESYPQTKPCPRCRGEGYLDGDNGMVLCPRCCGTGDA